MYEAGALIIAGGMLSLIGALLLAGKDVPGALWSGFGAAIGYYFGKKNGKERKV